MSLLEEGLRRQVIAEIYRRADDLDWDGLSPSDRSTWYVRWLDDPAIGGVLDLHMPRDQARLWIKDVPMKHYARARSGIGPYADLVGSHLPDADQLCRLAFGAGWAPLRGTLKDKPNRCTLTNSGGELAQMLWGPPRAFQSLVWASLNLVVDDQPTPIMLVVTRQGERLTDGQVGRHRRIAERIDVEVRHLTVGPVSHAAVTVRR
jgi:hypothetical protein